MKQTQKATFAFVMLAMLISLSSCGGSPISFCDPNFTQGNFSLHVSSVSYNANEFTFQVCNNTSYVGQQVSVYGATSAAAFTTMTPATNVRLAHLADSIDLGDTFDVVFQSGDTSFAIYADNASGDLSGTTQIIEGDGFRN